MPTPTATTVHTSSGIMNEWFTTALPILVLPVWSTATAASWVPFAGRNSTPETRLPHRDDGAEARAPGSPSAIGTSVRVVADWLVVSAAKTNTASANSSGTAVTHVAEQGDY